MYRIKERLCQFGDERKLVDYLNSATYEKCPHKDLYLLLLTTGMRIGEALVLDYEKDIDLLKNEIHIRRTQTKDINGKVIIGEITKTYNSTRTLKMNSISRKMLTKKINQYKY